MTLKKAMMAFVAVPVFLMAMIVLHEAGHAGTAKLLAGVECEIYIWPGFEIYPEFGHPHTARWNTGSLALTRVIPPESDAVLRRALHYNNAILFMGSGFTQLLSLMALSVIALCRPRGIVLWMLFPFALLHIDMLSYTVFPLLHLRHLLFWGGGHSETLMALGATGIPHYVSVPVIVLLSLAQFFWLYLLLRRPQPLDHQPHTVPVTGH